MRRIPFRWSRVAAGAFAIGAALAVLIAAPAVDVAIKDHRERAADRAAPLPASATEQAGILRAVLEWPSFVRSTNVPVSDAAAAPGEPDHPFVVADRTDTLCAETTDGSGGAAACALLEQWLGPAQYGGISTKLIRDLLIENRRASTLFVPASASALLVPSLDVDALLHETDCWDAFDRRYPHTRGLVRATRAVLTRDGSHALIYLTFGHRWFGFGDFFYLARSGDGWVVERKENFWIS